ncbi:MAG: 3-dehydroquinate synthase [Thiotrichales bacterium]
METLTVALGPRSYPIYIGSGLLSQSELITRHLRGISAMVVSNTTVAPLYLDRIKPGLQAHGKYAETILPDGEGYKNLETLNQVYTDLLRNRFDRRATLIALGGGVVGDMTGFAAATYQRGVAFVQVPTTLLAQVDSSVGGKTGVNHVLGKNMIGAFHQPRCVIIDIETLNTLPTRELAAGLAEVIKYGLIVDPAFFAWLEKNMDALLARDPAALTYAIRRSCELKAEVVASDEREQGQRALLNLGHTFGHAIETGSGYGNWLHGEAVGCGMVLAAELSASLGWIGAEEVARSQRLIERAGLPTHPPRAISVEQFLDLMAVDKKVLDGELRLVLLRAIGAATISSEASTDQIAAVLRRSYVD